MFKIHLALGFHVNLYHSYRGDGVDDSGIGPDIRMIRQILSELDTLNLTGIPVRGTWDFDNHFSLETRIPEYAPDILAKLQRRVTDAGDEVILVSYNKGMSSRWSLPLLGQTCWIMGVSSRWPGDCMPGSSAVRLLPMS